MSADRSVKDLLRPIAEPLIRRLARTKTMTNRFRDLACRDGWRPPSLETEDYLRASFGYDDEEGIKRAVSRVRPNTMVSFDRLATLWLQVLYLDRNRIPGDLVECGVWRGGAAAMMALAHLGSGSKTFRQLQLFDSWKGLPEPDGELDGTFAVEYSGGAHNGKLKPVGKCVASLDEARYLLETQVGYPSDLVHYHVGWFQETLPRTELGAISLLRLDGDWYESTKLCLEYLYPRVVKGGIVVLDDYGYWSGCRKATDEFLQIQSDPIMLHHIDDTGRYFLKP